MGCGASSTKGGQLTLDDKWDLFLSRAYNSGFSASYLLAKTSEIDRIATIESFYFTPEDAKELAKFWSRIKKGDDQKKPELKCDLALPQLVSLEQRRERRTETENRGIDYVYEYPDVPLDIPPNPVGLPRAEREGAQHAMDMFGTAIRTRMGLKFNAALDFIAERFVNETDPFKDWRDLYRTTTLPKSAGFDKDGNELWRTDKEFARQRLNGVNPTLIRLLVGGFPEKFPVTDSIVEGVLPAGATLAQLMEQKRIFWVDYEWLHDLPAPKENNCTAPIAAFFVDDNDDLMPLAIQLSQSPGLGAPIFTPRNCSEQCWMVAKLHVQAADAFIHEVSSHFFATHGIMELVYVAMKRNVSDHHPISHLLQPHFWFTMALNWSARRDLISPGGAVPRLMVGGYEGLVKLMSTAWQTWTFERFDIPYNFRRRGIWDEGDNKRCPKNYFRDDALEVWHVIYQYAKDMVWGIYKQEADIGSDPELAAWVKEMTDPMMLGLRGLPLDPSTGRMTTREHLTLFLTEIIYNVSAGHSAVNNGQWDYFGFIPCTPGKMRQRPPQTIDQKYTWCEVAAMLPGFTDSIDQITVVKALSSPPTQILGDFPKSFFANRSDLQLFIRTFQSNLKKLSAKIKDRNKQLEGRGEMPYTYLDPDQIAMSIAV